PIPLSPAILALGSTRQSCGWLCDGASRKDQLWRGLSASAFGQRAHYLALSRDRAALRPLVILGPLSAVGYVLTITRIRGNWTGLPCFQPVSCLTREGTQCLRSPSRR